MRDRRTNEERNEIIRRRIRAHKDGTRTDRDNWGVAVILAGRNLASGDVRPGDYVGAFDNRTGRSSLVRVTRVERKNIWGRAIYKTRENGAERAWFRRS